MITNIERRSNLSYAQFAQDYMYANRPIIVTDAIGQWKALSRWTPEFFKNSFGDMRFTISSFEAGQRPDGGNCETEWTLAQLIDRILDSTEDNPAPYFRNRILHEIFPSLKGDIEPLPTYFEPNWLPERYLVGHVEKILNRGGAIELYIGGKGAAFPILHYDGVGTHAFLMQIYGRKKFIVYSPDQESYLYPSPVKQNLSLVDIDKPDLERFPLFASAVPLTFVLEPGELLFVPSRWWHTTKMLTPSITISVNTVNRSNWHALVEFVVNRRSNPFISMASRMYLTGAGTWRAWRDRSWGHRIGAAMTQKTSTNP